MTAGRNAVIVAPSADLDEAVADIVAGAFARAGQAATAVSLVIVVGAVARSARFTEQLKDAVSSLRVGRPTTRCPTSGRWSRSRRARSGAP